MNDSENIPINEITAMSKIRSYVVEQVLDGRAEGLEPESPLLEWGVINSIEILRLNHFLSAEFAIEIPVELMVAENYRNLQAIAALVNKLAKR